MLRDEGLRGGALNVVMLPAGVHGEGGVEVVGAQHGPVTSTVRLTAPSASRIACSFGRAR